MYQQMEDLQNKGSENQRILDVQECLKEHKIVQVALQLRSDKLGTDPNFSKIDKLGSVPNLSL